VTRGELLAELAASLGAPHEARFIVEEVVGSDSSRGGSVGARDLELIRSLASRRLAGEPLQYVLGHWSFRTLDLLVDQRVLIPRPETEQVVEVALGEVRRLGNLAPSIVDVGTGTGAIALSMATELVHACPAGRLWAIDVSPDALAVARENLERVAREGEALLPVTLMQGSWLTPLPSELKGSVDLVVSNPPYVAVGEWFELDDEVRSEPRLALVADEGTDGTPGLRDVEEVLTQAWAWLSRPGVVVVELSPPQEDAALLLARRLGYDDVRVEPDLAQRPRTLVARAG